MHTNAIVQRNANGTKIFAEPTGRRWNSFIVFSGSMLATVCFLSAILGISSLSTPELSLQEKLPAYQTIAATRETAPPLPLAPPAARTAPLLSPAEQSAPIIAATPQAIVPAETIADVPAAITASVEPKSPAAEIALSPAAPVIKSPVNSDEFPSFTWVAPPTNGVLTEISGIDVEEPSPDFFN